MYTAFSLKALTQSLCYISFTVFLFIFLTDWPPELDITLLRKMAFSVTITLFIIPILGARWGLWRWLRNIEFLNTFLFPDLSGTWRGNLQSNWPIVGGKILGNTDGNNKINFSHHGEAELKEIPITLRIKMDWFEMSIEMETDNNYSSSKTISINLKRHDNFRNNEITYNFENTSTEPQHTDEAIHFGTARMEIRWRDTPEMTGSYWTNRKWRQGLNTAGIIYVKRLSKDPDFSVKDGRDNR